MRSLVGVIFESLSTWLPSIFFLQTDNLKELKAVRAHFRTVESYRASEASREIPMGEYGEQLSQLRQYSAEIEKEIAETKSHLASLRRDLAINQATISVAKTQLRAEADLNVSFRRELHDFLSKHPEMK